MNSVSFMVKGQKGVITKYFDDLRKQRLFLLRCRYSKKVMITGYTYQDEEEYLYLEFGR